MTFHSLIFPVLILTLPAVASAAETLAPMALNGFGIVPAKIMGARVVDTKGVAVGTIQRIETDPRGKPLRADILLPSGQVTPVDASALGYDESANVLVSAGDTGRPPQQR